MPPVKTVADIGCDHGYVAIALLNQEKCKRVIATDLRRGPLEVTVRNVQKSGLTQKVDCRLGDGMQPLKPGEAEAIVIAGMGGKLMAQIIQDGMQKAQSAKVLLLQPMNGCEELRSFLFQNGFHIYDEELCKEDGKIYQVICVRYDGFEKQKSALETFLGEQLIQKNDPLLREFIQQRKNVVAKILDGLSKSQQKNSQRFSYYYHIQKELLNCEKRLQNQDLFQIS